MEICCCHFLERLNCRWLLSDAHFKAMNLVGALHTGCGWFWHSGHKGEQTNRSTISHTLWSQHSWMDPKRGVGTRITSACRNPMTKLSFNFFLSTHVSFFGVSHAHTCGESVCFFLYLCEEHSMNVLLFSSSSSSCTGQRAICAIEIKRSRWEFWRVGNDVRYHT